MGLQYAPRLDTDGLIFTYQPGQTTIFNNFTATNAPDVSPASNGCFTGPRRKYEGVYDDRSNTYNGQPVLEIANLGGSIYNLNASQTSTYTISLWVRLVQFPSKYLGTSSVNRGSRQVTKSKRAALARFDFRNTPGYNNGYIEFGAMAPYYLDSAGDYTYKSVFSPISFGAAICGAKYITTVYTDYKFNLNEWYLITLQLESNTNFSNISQALNVKMFVNNTQENIAKCLGVAWRQTGTRAPGKPKQPRKRYTGKVAAQPGFANSIGANTSFSANAAFQTITYSDFFNLSALNYASFSPIRTFGRLNKGVNDGINTPFNAGASSSFYKYSSSVNFGQLYIYNKPFNTSTYSNFKSLYT
jgi:hypothetical protein